MLHYNENKVAAGEARLLLASGFAGEATQFSLAQKLQRFEYLTMLNSHVKTNAIHITLNFDPQDKLTNEMLQQVSLSYMAQIGFGDQPFLVYRHNDAAHTHVHIASVNIRADGSRIDTHGIGWKLSEPARQQIEKEFGLIVAKGRENSNSLAIRPADLEKAVYGQTPSKRAITNIVNAVIGTYTFTSLAEFNAILQQFNVRADRGAEGTLMHEKKGLLYSLINSKGEAIGVPIKASAIYNKPTLPSLEKQFYKNLERRKPFKEPLKTLIDKTIGRYTAISKATLIRELQEQNIAVLFRTNEQGITYGVTYVDHRKKTVFNGSDLGKAYSAKGLLERLSPMNKTRQREKAKVQIVTVKLSSGRGYLAPPYPPHYLKLAFGKSKPEALPGIPKKKKRKKKDPEQEQSRDL